jgi:hypothetical protein
MNNYQIINGIKTALSLEEEDLLEIAKKAYDLEQVELAKTAYQRQRSLEYPPIADYLDGIVKGDTAQVQAYVDACLAVKVKYPKPE